MQIETHRQENKQTDQTKRITQKTVKDQTKKTTIRQIRGDNQTDSKTNSTTNCLTITNQIVLSKRVKVISRWQLIIACHPACSNGFSWPTAWQTDMDMAIRGLPFKNLLRRMRIRDYMIPLILMHFKSYTFRFIDIYSTIDTLLHLYLFVRKRLFAYEAAHSRSRLKVDTRHLLLPKHISCKFSDAFMEHSNFQISRIVTFHAQLKKTRSCNIEIWFCSSLGIVQKLNLISHSAGTVWQSTGAKKWREA